MVKIEYVDNDKNKGIKVDWQFIFKEYKKLGCPKNVFNPCHIPFNDTAYQILLSERKTGKTTNVLLLGMLLYKHYGIIPQYIRASETMIMNKTIDELFKTVREFGYIEKITDGRYNDVFYHARKWSYCKTENGEIVEKAPTHFMYCMSVDRSDYYKSSYNCPTGDFIIFDEFIGSRYRLNEFVYFMDLLSTIIRKRTTAKIIMLANTIDKHSEYFNEFEIYDDIQLLEVGGKEIFTTELGTRIYIELIADKEESQIKQAFNRLYFGFKNPKMNSIKGGEWATNNYPHIERGYKKLQSGLYIVYHDRLLALDIVEYDDIGLCLNCHKASKTYDDSIIYSLSEPKDRRYRYYMGVGDNLDKFIVSMVKRHKIRFQNNACGTIFFNHFNQKDARKSGY